MHEIQFENTIYINGWYKLYRLIVWIIRNPRKKFYDFQIFYCSMNSIVIVWIFSITVKTTAYNLKRNYTSSIRNTVLVQDSWFDGLIWLVSSVPFRCAPEHGGHTRPPNASTECVRRMLMCAQYHSNDDFIWIRFWCEKNSILSFEVFLILNNWNN